MTTLLLIVGIIFFLVLAYCATQESKVFAPYKVYGVFGRLKAYLALDFTTAGFFLWLSSAVSAFIPSLEGSSMGYIGVVGGALLFGVGLYMYYSTYLLCPTEIRAKCISSMIVVGMGVTIKICLFFLPFIWKVATYSAPVSVSSSAPEKKKVTRVWKEDFYGNRTYYKVGTSGEYYQDEDGNWKRIKGA